MDLNWPDILAIVAPIVAVVVFLNKSLERKMDIRFQAVDQQIEGARKAIDQQIEGVRTAMDQQIEGVRKDLREMREDIREIRSDVKSIDQRMTRLEGRFDERGYWESRKKTGTEDN